MKELLEKVIVLVKEAEAKIIELGGLIDKNKIKATTLSEKEIAIERKEADLAARENKIKHIEDVVAIEAKNEETGKQLKKDSVQVDVERNAFVKYQEQIKVEHKAKNDLIETKTKAADAKEAKYTQALKDLKEEEKNLKDKILKKISKNI